MAIRLLALDVDGTITNSRNEITPATVAAIRRAMDAGLTVALNTGRDLSESRQVLDLVPEIHYLMGCTGAYLMDLRSGKRLVSHAMDASLARAAHDILRRYDTMVNLYMDDEVYNDDWALRDFDRFYPPALRSVMNAHHAVPDLGVLLAAREAPVDKYYVMFTDEAEHREAMAQMQQLPLFVTRAAFLDMEIMHAAANKGAILRDLAGLLGLDMTEVAAVGDSENDAPMLRAAGLSAAMGNAKPAVQALADVVAPRSDEDGLAWAIDRILKEAV